MAIGPTVTLTFAGDSRRLERAMDRVGQGAQRLRVEVDSTSNRLVDSFASASSSLLKFGANSAVMGGTVGSVLPALAGLAAGLAQASGAALILPGVLMAGAAAMGVLKIATSGFGDAMKALDDPAKFAEAIAKLAPAAQDTARAVQGLKPQLDSLKATVQERFFTGFAEEVRVLGRTYLPILEEKFGSIAGRMNAMARVAADVLAKPDNVDRVNKVLANTDGLFGELRYSVGRVTSGFLALGSVGSEYLPALGAGISEVTRQFMNWANAAAESGRLNEIIDGGIAALKTLGQIAGNVGSILGGIWNAANLNGGTLLDRISEITARISGVVNSVEGQEAIGTFFSTLSTLAGYLGEALTTIAPVLPSIAAAFGVLATTTGGLLLQALQLVAPYLDDIAGLLTVMAPVLVPLAAGILVVTKAITAWKAAQELLNIAMRMNPLGLVVTAIGLLVAALVYAWNNSETFRNIVTAVWETVSGAITRAVDWIKGAIGWFGELPGLVGGWFGRTKDAAIEKFNGLVEWIKRVPGMILSAVGDLGSLLLNVGRDLLTGLWNGITGAAGWLKSKIGGFFGDLLPGWVKNMLGIGSPSKVFRDEVGHWIPEGVARGIQANSGSAIDAARQMANATVAASIPPVTSLTNVGSAAQEILNLWKSGGNLFEDFSIKGMSSSAKKLNGTISDLFYSTNRGFDFGRGGDDPRIVENFLRDLVARETRTAAPAATGGPTAVNVHFSGNLDSAFAAAFMKLVRTGQIQFA